MKEQRTRAASAAAARARVKTGSTENAEGALRRSRSAEASRVSQLATRVLSKKDGQTRTFLQSFSVSSFLKAPLDDFFQDILVKLW